MRRRALLVIFWCRVRTRCTEARAPMVSAKRSNGASKLLRVAATVAPQPARARIAAMAVAHGLHIKSV